MALLILLQLVLPTVLSVVALARPSASLLGRVAQMAALGSTALALWITGVWLFPPWWTVSVYVLALAIVFLLTAVKPPRVLWPVGRFSWAVTIGYAGFAAFAAREAVLGVQGYQPPNVAAVSISSPLRGGSFLVVNGGTTDRVSSHIETLDPQFRGHRDYRGQSYGVDIVQLNAFGGTSTGIFPRDPRKWRIYGQPVYSPCAATVKDVRDGIADTPVPLPDRRNMTGNSVLLDCGEFEILLAHLAPGSIGVLAGQRVSKGQAVAAVGNTGNTAAPHLHIHAQRPSTTSPPFAGEPVPMLIGGRFLVRNDHLEH